MADDVETIEAETEVENVEVEAASEPSEIDALATELGWRPKAEWQGDESQWVDSKAFLRKSREIGKSTAKELKDLRKQMEGIGKATATMTQRAVEAERARWQQQLDEAWDAGDRQAATIAEKALKQLDKPVDVPNETQDFMQRNSAWFQKDTEATDYAMVRAQHYADRGIVDPGEQLAKVEADVKRRFPEHFEEAPQKKAPPSLATPQRQVAHQPKEKGYATLPPQARKAVDEWARGQQENNGWDDKRVASAKADWAKHYYEQEASNG